MCILPPEFQSFGPVGLPVPSVEIKFIDVPEAGYFANGKIPQGIILHFIERFNPLI